jgi:hypothetical protein
MPHFEAVYGYVAQSTLESRSRLCNSCSFVTLSAHHLSFSAAIKVSLHA